MRKLTLLLCIVTLTLSASVSAQVTSNVGPIDNTFGGGGNYNFLADGLVFDALTSFTIDSFECYPLGAGDIVVNLNAGSTVIATYTQTVAGPGLVVVTPGFQVPAGTGYTIDALGTTTGGLFRNNAAAVYPYSSAGVCDITGPINALAGFYYFFYNWTITTGGPFSTPWETNSAEASMDFNGTQGGPYTPALNAAAAGSTVTFNASTSLIGTPADIVVTTSAIVPSSNPGSLSTPNGQVVNLDLTMPFFSFFGGIGVPVQLTPWLGDVSGATFTPGLGIIGGQMVAIDAGNLDGFSLSQATTIEITPCTPGSDFETVALGLGSYPVGWDGGDSVVAGTLDWTTDDLGTTSANTGPTTGAGASANYLYCETSGAGGTATFVFETCDIDISTLAAPMLTLEFNANGASIGVLTVEEITAGGGVPSAPAVTIHAGGDLTDIWNAYATPVTPGATVRLRFTYVAGGTFTGDIALDNISIQ